MKGGQGQTLLDVAVECCGSAEAAWDVAAANGLSLTQAVAGVDVEVPSVPEQPAVVAALAAAGAKPACDGNPAMFTKKTIGESTIGTDRIW